MRFLSVMSVLALGAVALSSTERSLELSRTDLASIRGSDPGNSGCEDHIWYTNDCEGPNENIDECLGLSLIHI